MKGDFSRLTFDAKRHFAGVRYEQGRVQIDADANEAGDIVGHRLDVTVRDIVGDAAGPVDPDSFKVAIAANAITVSPGRYYVAGRLLENDALVTLPVQPFLTGGYCVLGTGDPAFDVAKPAAGEYAVLLDSWVRHVTILEMPELLEPALGGVPTASRLQSVWQIKLLKLPAGTSCGGVQGTAAWLHNAGPSPARLEAGTDTPPPAPDLCDLSPSGGYQGLENDLYRVEIHAPGVAGAGAGAATFKWAHANASFCALATSWDNDRTLTVGAVPGDLTRGFQIGDTVELIDVATELRELPGTMLTIADLVDDTMTLSGPHLLGTATSGAAAAARQLRVRRWGAGPLAIPKNTNWLALGDDGVRVNFDKVAAFRTGEHWMIPARTATNDIEWPGGAQPPANIPHVLTPLARVKVTAGGFITLLGDCRTLFPPLGAMIALLYVGGDGQQAEPQEAGNAAPLALAEPLVVGVFRGKLPVAGAPVRFDVLAGAGTLAGGGATATVLTGNDGLASCAWALDAGIGDTPQQVEARMLDDGGTGFGNPVRFGARVLGLIEMKLAGGDTQAQINPPGGVAPIELPEPLRVAVTRANRPLANALVRFTVAAGGGSVRNTGGGAGAATVDILTDAQGIAACLWTLIPGAAPNRLLAQLMKNAGTLWGPPDVLFSGTLIDLPPPGEACCVTVGKDAQFETLDAAVGALVKTKVADMCLCLKPGDHQLKAAIQVNAGRETNLMIHGCGPATRLDLADKSISALGIGTLELADLRLLANDKPILAQGLAAAVLRRVQGTSVAPILDAQACDLVVIEDCDLGLLNPPGLAPKPKGKSRPAKAPKQPAKAVDMTLALAKALDFAALIPVKGAIDISRNLIFIDSFEGDIRIVGSRLAGSVNIGRATPSALSYRDYWDDFTQHKFEPAFGSGGLLTILDNSLYDLRITGALEQALGLDKRPPKGVKRLTVPRVARLQRNTIFSIRSVVTGLRVFVETNRFEAGGADSEMLLVVAPRDSDKDPRVKIVANSGAVDARIFSTGYVDGAANAPLAIT